MAGQPAAACISYPAVSQSVGCFTSVERRRGERGGHVTGGVRERLRTRVAMLSPAVGSRGSGRLLTCQFTVVTPSKTQLTPYRPHSLFPKGRPRLIASQSERGQLGVKPPYEQFDKQGHEGVLGRRTSAGNHHHHCSGTARVTTFAATNKPSPKPSPVILLNCP